MCCSFRSTVQFPCSSFSLYTLKRVNRVCAGVDMSRFCRLMSLDRSTHGVMVRSGVVLFTCAMTRGILFVYCGVIAVNVGWVMVLPSLLIQGSWINIMSAVLLPISRTVVTTLDNLLQLIWMRRSFRFVWLSDMVSSLLPLII